jgi:hypothetical protein
MICPLFLSSESKRFDTHVTKPHQQEVDLQRTGGWTHGSMAFFITFYASICSNVVKEYDPPYLRSI